MLWLNFLHFYQPATADRETISAAIAKSYTRLTKALLKNPGVKFTGNISGCLLEKIDESGHRALLEGWRKLIRRGQLELVGSAAYHPILPLIPAAEARAQIKLQEELLKKYFGDVKLRGFFLPEMAYSSGTAELIKKLGYEWIILDEISRVGDSGTLNCSRTYRDLQSGLTVIFRDRQLSQSYVPKEIVNLLAENKTAVTATDAELYGLRYADLSGNLEKLLKSQDLQTKTISAFIKDSSPTQAANLLPSSWESTPLELGKGNPYALWYDDKNKIHSKLWKLARLSWEAVERYSDDEQHIWAERHLRQGLASCTFWWASGKDFKNLFGSLSWNPDEIERGVNELTKAIRSLEDPSSRSAKVKAEKLCLEIKKLIWNKHWKYYWHR